MESMNIDDQLPENKHSIYDPEYFIAAKDLIYMNQIGVLSEIRMWAIELFRRIYKQVEKNAHELMIVSVLYKQAIVAFDSAIICLDNCAINPAMHHARSLLESRLYLAWVFYKEHDKQYLGRQIYVSTKRHELQMLKMIIPETKEYILNAKAWKESGRDYSKPSEEEVEKAKKVVQRIEALLNKDNYREINQSFEKLSTKHEVPWFKPGKYGVKSIFKLAEKLKKLPEYIHVYGITSLYTHGSVSFIHSKFLEDAKHQIEPIRTLEGFPIVFHLVSNNILFILDMMVREYREGEITILKNKHESWKQRIDNIPKFEILVKENLI
jgi:hypothetical protein